MYIKQISIDGFKSYAQRTVVDGFDPMFNAITGLNGSGKSNILDSICFVLGITNLNQVMIVLFFISYRTTFGDLVLDVQMRYWRRYMYDAFFPLVSPL